jgi:hypothetical protein
MNLRFDRLTQLIQIFFFFFFISFFLLDLSIKKDKAEIHFMKKNNP